MKKTALVALACLITVGTAACSSPSSSPSASPSQASLTIRIGDLQTDDLLPLWVAQNNGMLTAAGLNVTIQTFQSAQEESTAVQAGQLDAMMTDVLVPTELTDGGTKMRFVTALQGAPAGIVAAPGSGITTASQLAGAQIGTASNTIIQYIVEKALTDAGVPASQINTSEVPKLPVRLQMLMAGQVKAAGLPWTLYYLAVSQGATPVVGPDVTGGYTPTVLAFRQAWLDQPGAAATIQTLLKVYDQAVDVINANPDAQRPLIAQKANLSSSIADTYPVRTYPKSGAPDEAGVTDVLNWATAKGYLKTTITYQDLVYNP